MHLRLIFIRFSMIYKVKQIKNPHPIEVSVPGSKSITNRALLIAALAKGRSRLKGVLFSDDSRHFIQALIDLGFTVDVDEENCIVTIDGLGGVIPKKKAHINVGSAGTAARFLTAYLGLSEGEYYIDSSEQMKKRPMKELLESLEDLGSVITYGQEENHFPFEIGCPDMRKNEVVVDVDKSSQFLSALLISSVLFDSDFRIKVTGTHGMAYVDMTIQMMEQFGVRVERLDDTQYTAEYFISGDSYYLNRDYNIEPDMSAACYFYAMSPLLGVTSMVNGVHSKSLQGDIRFLNVLEDMDCVLEEKKDGIVVCPPEDNMLKGGKWDLSTFSDQTLTLAAIAPFASGKVQISGIGHIRFQECDRINAIIENLTAMGIEVSEKEGTITIIPGKVKGCLIKTFEDHRVAMSFAICGLVTDGIEIENPLCCRKTFENYFDVLESIM